MMKEPGIKDTTAFKIVRQITDHVYGPETKISDEDFVHIFHDYGTRGGSWERLMDGDMGCVKIVEDAIDSFVKGRQTASIAARVAAKKYR
jgi:hypothetical protein